MLGNCLIRKRVNISSILAGFDTGFFAGGGGGKGGNISITHHFWTRHWDLYGTCFGVLVVFVF